VVAAGYDTLCESFDLYRFPEVEDQLMEAKAAAAEKGRDQRVQVELGFEVLSVAGYGTGSGVQLWADADDGSFSLQLRSRQMSFSTTIRYSSVGLWHFGVDGMRRRVRDFLGHLGRLGVSDETLGELQSCGHDDCFDRLGSAHYAVDVWSSAFGCEMAPELAHQVVAHQESKQRIDGHFALIGRGSSIETLTIGNIKGCQIQIYDKGLELLEKSGKDWLVDIWRRNGFTSDLTAGQVYRVEIRFAKDYLRDRDIRTFDDFGSSFQQLCGEALFKRRLVSATGPQKDRRPIHWLWGLVLATVEGRREWRPLGRPVRWDGDRLALSMSKQAAGVLRNLSVIVCGGDDELERCAGLALSDAWRDKAGQLKTDRAIERYRDVVAPRYAGKLGEV